MSETEWLQTERRGEGESACRATQPFGKSVREKNRERFSEVRSKYYGILCIERDDDDCDEYFYLSHESDSLDVG